MSSPDNIIDYLALWAVKGIGSATARKLIAYTGSAKAVFNLKKSQLIKVPGIGPQLAATLNKKDCYLRAEKELAFAEKYNISITPFFSDDYPFRLKQCEDAPLIIFTKGNLNFHDHYFISLIGTRKATKRGADFCEKLIEDIVNRGHKVVIVSGLAYGIDIAAHKAALKFKVPTIGVLAHGLDTIYPASHRKYVVEMIEQGGIVTEFMSEIFPDKTNFVRRNRIIAGLSDATIVVESGLKGGSLLTADMANSYNREVFAVPGRPEDKYSDGCNNLIKTNKAALIEGIDDLEYQMGWLPQQNAQQKELFVELTEQEKEILNLFENGNELTIDALGRLLGLSMAKLSPILLNMEFKGVLNCLPGKVYSIK